MYAADFAHPAAIGGLARPQLRQQARVADPPPDPRDRPGRLRQFLRAGAVAQGRGRPRPPRRDVQQDDAELRQQHDRLTAARDLIDRRRRFTEAVLSGVSAGVISMDGKGPHHRRSTHPPNGCCARAGTAGSASRLEDAMPELAPSRRGRARRKAKDASQTQVPDHPRRAGPHAHGARGQRARRPTASRATSSRWTTSPISSPPSAQRPGPTLPGASRTRSRTR